VQFLDTLAPGAPAKHKRMEKEEEERMAALSEEQYAEEFGVTREGIPVEGTHIDDVRNPKPHTARFSLRSSRREPAALAVGAGVGGLTNLYLSFFELGNAWCVTHAVRGWAG
jgi:hypothetical protein